MPEWDPPRDVPIVPGAREPSQAERVTALGLRTHVLTATRRSAAQTRAPALRLDVRAARRQVRVADQIAVDRTRGLAALGDRPDDE